MLLAAGLGTRLKPWTDHHPKCLAPVNGKPLLQKNIEYLQQFGISNVVINVHHFAEQVVAAVKENKGWGSQINFSDESDEVLETGGGLRKAAPHLQDEPFFVVMNSDILTDMNLGAMIQQHLNTGALATLAVSARESSRYFLFDEKLHLCGWENTKTGEKKLARQVEHAQKLAFSGIQVLSNEIFKLMKQEGKFSLVDVYLSLCKDYKLMAFESSDASFLDVGKPDALEKAEKMFT